jgi:hypothetical protein
MDDILDVVVWSLRAAFIGRFPDQRHDGEWQRTDVRRRKLTRPIGVRSALVRITGVWKAYKDIWRFPQFNEVRGICWLARRRLRPTWTRRAQRNGGPNGWAIGLVSAVCSAMGCALARSWACPTSTLR